MSPVPPSERLIGHGILPILQQNSANRLSSQAETLPISWQRELAQAIRCPNELLRRLRLISETETTRDFELRYGLRTASTETQSAFPLLVPESFVRRMEPENPNDPLLRQVLPMADEAVKVDGYVADAVGDLDARLSPGLLHKYAGRVLLITTGACAVHCRYCFRRNYPYSEEPRHRDDWMPALQTIAADVSITEVILSGGDPLMLSDVRLMALCEALDEIPHVERLRIHTRLPVVLPSRVTPDFLQMITSLRSQCVCVIHVNHAREIKDDCETALRSLVRCGIPVLNQAVLLRGINDSICEQERLCRQLINIGIMPYYLHQLDHADGTAHFDFPEAAGRELVEQLTERLPGYAVPRYVREIPGHRSKTPIASGGHR